MIPIVKKDGLICYIFCFNLLIQVSLIVSPKVKIVCKSFELLYYNNEFCIDALKYASVIFNLMNEFKNAFNIRRRIQQEPSIDLKQPILNAADT